MVYMVEYSDIGLPVTDGQMDRRISALVLPTEQNRTEQNRTSLFA